MKRQFGQHHQAAALGGRLLQNLQAGSQSTGQAYAQVVSRGQSGHFDHGGAVERSVEVGKTVFDAHLATQ